MDYEDDDTVEHYAIEDGSPLMMTKSIREYKGLAEALDINLDKLGCVMLKVLPINIWHNDLARQMLDRDDLYVSPNPDHFWVNGDVLTEGEGHVTLLYGLLTPAYEQKDNVDVVLEKWEAPKYLHASEIVAFPSPFDDENYVAIVAKVSESAIKDAHARLSYLPHINVHAKFEPHITLFYVKANVADYWLDVLRRFPIDFTVADDGIDYGAPAPEKSDD